MVSKKKIILAIAVILILGIAVLGITVYTNYTQGKASFQGKHNILVLCVDPTEQRMGVGAVDMAFVIELNDGKLGNVTPVYPGGLYDPSLNPPADLRSEGVDHWYLHDSLWTADLEEGTKRAQQIVKYNTGMNSDIVAVITPDAIDAMVNTVGPVYSNGREITTDSLSFLRNDQDEHGATRGDAVEGLADGIINATRSSGKKADLLSTVVDQYSKGNIQVVPGDVFQKLVAYVGISNILS
ncbi:MAG: hypothetical protein BZ138_02240 [Methanosphaera sp. rholeuAM270]|nr:MAG: hypothetical protein BZ138_02240 [Methanosphaera sp. rholeuAM270]